VTDLTDGDLHRDLTSTMSTWVILVTDGTVIDYPPEAYLSRETARNEARRWAWIISGMGWIPIEEPEDDRWTVDDRDVRLVHVEGEGGWVGTFWTWDGYPDPEATLLEDRTTARAWVTAPLHDVLAPVAVEENDWMIIATFDRGGEEAYAVAHVLKRVGGR
jgi:hypothetical protein